MEKDQRVPLNILNIRPNYYWIDTNGKVYNIDNICLKPFISNSGYYRLNLVLKNGKQKKFSVHRLVAFVFIKNDDPIRKKQVNHKDGDKLNNKVENLEWVSQSENVRHAYNTNLCKAKGSNSHFANPDIYSDEIIHKICKLLEDHYMISEIIIMVGLMEPPLDALDKKSIEYQRYRSYIKQLRARKFRHDITNQYTY